MPKSLTFENYEILAAGATKTFTLTPDIDAYRIYTSAPLTLLADMTFGPTGTPGEGDTFCFYYEGGVTVSSYAVEFFGTELTAAQALYA